MEETLEQIRYLDHQLQLNELTDAQQELVSNHRLASNLRRTVRHHRPFAQTCCQVASLGECSRSVVGHRRLNLRRG